MNNWRAYSSKDMKSWTCHGVIMDWKTYSWGGSDSWASQVAKGADGKFYHYTTLVGKFDMGYGCRCTGVSVSDTPIGPWKDAIGRPLVKDSDTPSPYGWDDIDPTILIDDDGTVWMAWGNPVCYLAKLKKNMVEIDGEIRTMPLPNYTEGPWLFKRNGIYYLVYVSHNHLGYGEKVSYATAKSMEDPWTYRGLLCENPGGGSFGIHPGICQFKGQWYFFYFNAGLQIPGPFQHGPHFLHFFPARYHDEFSHLGHSGKSLQSAQQDGLPHQFQQYLILARLHAGSLPRCGENHAYHNDSFKKKAASLTAS